MEVGREIREEELNVEVGTGGSGEGPTAPGRELLWGGAELYKGGGASPAQSASGAVGGRAAEYVREGG